jgi:hypothetical protein
VPRYLLIVDDCSAPFGHINVDGIEERWHPAPPSPGDDCIKPKPDKGKMIIQDRASAGIEGAEVPEITQSIGNYPNPFNPETEIIVRGSPYRNMAVVIYSVSGAEMNLLHVKTDASGIGLVRWNGQDSFGRAVSAGVYIAVLKEGPNTIATCKLILVR